MDKISFSHLASLWDIAGKRKREEKKESAQKLVLVRSMLMHVLHHICAKVREEEWRVKLPWIRYLISAGVYIFHPIPPSPLLASLLFDFSLSSVCWKSWLCCSQWVLQVSVCAMHCSLLFSLWWEKLEITMSGGGVRPLCFLFHLFSLCSHFCRWQWFSLQVSCRCGPFGTFWGSIFYAHKHTHWDVSVSVCTDMSVLKYSHKGSNTCTRHSSQCVNKVGDHLPNVFIFLEKPWKQPC